MRLIGLTGHIGAGKSTVGELLAERGAVVIDADRLYREVVEPLVLPAIVERFGESVRAPDGTLDRPALSAIVFTDEQARKDLNAITFPAIGRAIFERVRENTESEVVVIDVPLMRTKGQYGVELMVVVTADPAQRVRRLVEQRGMDEQDARARVDAQLADLADRDEPDVVIDNSGTRAELAAAVDAFWARLATP